MNKKLQKELYIALLNIIDEELLSELISSNLDNFLYLKNPSEKNQLDAVIRKGSLIKYIKNPSDLVKLYAVQNQGSAIKYIKKPSEKIQLAAIRKNPYSIEYIKEPTKNVQIEAVKSEGEVIFYIKDPCRKIQYEAIINLKNHFNFCYFCLDKITHSLYLSMLYNKIKDDRFKKMIKESKYWKDDANLILEAFNE